MRENPSRVQFAEKLQEVIDRYNQGSKTTEELFEEWQVYLWAGGVSNVGLSLRWTHATRPSEDTFAWV